MDKAENDLIKLEQALHDKVTERTYWVLYYEIVVTESAFPILLGIHDIHC